ncbi:MAG: T9SS type A sorting domain-containing protein [Candidatus Cloacimonetes bacterium]|nr:T9SS type A sorting domain-containing protein [Candidatus Cloacimonadota bacterium]
MKKTLLTLILAGVLLFAFAVPRNLVVVEIATGTWCPYCPGAAMGADDLITNSNPAAIIENHNGDNYANTYSNARNSYYGISGFPTAMFDGLNPVEGGSNTQSMYPQYLTRVNARMAIPSKYTISATGSITGNTLSITANVAKPEDDSNSNIVLHCVITQSHIQHNWQGQTHLNFVNRLMIPNQSGTPVSLATGGQQTYNLSGTFDPSWNINSCEAVLFLQCNTTKEILQGVKYSLPGLLGSNPVSATELNFPDTYVSGHSTLDITLNNFFEFEVNGTISSSNPVFTPIPATFTIQPYQSTTISVEFAPAAATNYTGTLTIDSNLSGYNQVQIPLTGTGFNNTAPNITNIQISGPPVVYQQLSVSYDFADPDGDTEGETEFQWVQIINNQPVDIEDATEQTYTIDIADIGWQLACRVTPKDQYGMPGTPVFSNYTLPIEELPPPQNLTATVTAPNTVTLHWEKPNHFDNRGFVGYRIFRNSFILNNVMNVNTLEYVDTEIPDGTYEYWVCSIFNSPYSVSNPSNSVTVIINLPNSDELAPALESVNVYPNPFKENTTFQINGKANRPITVEIYNLKGQLIHRLNSVIDQNGSTQLSWNALDTLSKPIPTGIYFYRVKSEGISQNGKLIKVR